MFMGEEAILKVVIEGSGAGLENGRLGLSYFNESFRELLRAYRAIATMFISSAESEDVNTRAQGRKPRLAEQMDLEIDSITHQSPPTIRLVCPIPKVETNRTNELFAKDIVRRSAAELVDAIESEARGNPRNKYVRRFLQKLPPGTQNQLWQLYEAGELVKTITIQNLHLPPMELATTGIVRVQGRISGIYFSPTAEIRITDESVPSWFKASEEQVEKAISLRNEPVEAVGIQKGGKLNLLWIRKQDTLRRPERDERDRYFAVKWAGALKRLAK
jgi:hypothetical protein